MLSIFCPLVDSNIGNDKIVISSSTHPVHHNASHTAVQGAG